MKKLLIISIICASCASIKPTKYEGRYVKYEHKPPLGYYVIIAAIMIAVW